MSDQENVLDALKGDKKAYGRLVDSYQGVVFAVALNITGNYSDSQDIVQEVFITAYQKLRTLSKPSNFNKWLYTIAKRVSYSFLRKKKRTPNSTVEKIDIAKIKAQALTAAQEYAHKEFNALVWKQVHNLPRKSREAILLYYIEGFSIKKAAAFLSITESAMQSRLKIARKRIRQNLDEKLEAELRHYRPSQKSRNYILAALPAGGVPKIGLLTSLATKGALTMAAISAKKIAIIAAAIVIATISTITIINRTPTPGPVVPPVVENDEQAGDKKRVVEKESAHIEDAGAVYSIQGRVQDDENNPVGDAVIKLYASTKPDSPVFKTTSDFNGSFELKELENDHAYILLAEHEDYYAELVNDIDSSTPNISIIFKTSVTITGLVVNYDEMPVQEATIELITSPDAKLGSGEIKHIRTARSGIDGKFIILNVVPGQHSASASADNYLSSNPVILEVGAPRTPIKAILLVLKSPSTVSGIVVDEEFNPVAKAEFLVLNNSFKRKYGVAAHRESRGNPSLALQSIGGQTDLLLPTQKTGVDGKFALTFTGKGYYQIYALHPDYGPSTPYDVTINGNEIFKDITLVLSSEKASIFGNVMDENRQKIVDAKVRTVWIWNMDYDRNYDVPYLFLEMFFYDHQLNNNNMRTDENGEFNLTPSMFGTYQITISKKSYIPYETEKFAVDENHTDQEFEIILSRAHKISGKIYSKPQVPLSEIPDQTIGLSVALTRPDKEPIYRRGMGFDLKKDGSFVINNIPEGMYELLFNLNLGENSFRHVVKNVAAGTSDLEVVLINNPAKITGKIIDGGSYLPIQDFTLKFTSYLDVPAFRNIPYYSTVSLVRNISSTEGTLAIDDIPQGTYSKILISATDYSSIEMTDVELKAGEIKELGEIKLYKGVDISGKVVSAWDGSPIQGAEIIHSKTKVVSEEDGTFVLPNIPAKEISLEVLHPAYARKIEKIKIDSASSGMEHVIQLSKQAAAIHGTVKRPDGTPLPDFEVQMFIAGRFLVWTDEDGAYYAESLPVGKENRIVCGHHTRTIALEDGQDMELDFVIPKGHTLSGKIVDKSLGPMKMEVYIRPPNSDYRDRVCIYAHTNNSGEFSVPKIPEGQYILTFHIYVGTAGKPVWAYQYSQIIEITDKDMELNVITETSLFSGKLVDFNGIPLSRLMAIEPINNPDCKYTGHSKDDGTFDYGRIPPGKYNMFVDNVFVKNIEIPAGKDLTDLKIRVD
jgi:RNA polymerase sigma factor (sigma-70 family)